MSEDKSTKVLLIIALTVIGVAGLVAACGPKVPPGGYPAGYADGACTALTGTPACDYTAMNACQDPRGLDPDTVYPCAWIPSRDGGPVRPATVIVDHACPAMVWPGEATCLSVTPADRRTP